MREFFNLSFPIGRIFAIDMRIHVLFVIYAAYQLIGGMDEVRLSLIMLTMLFLIVLCHEFGHCFGARSVGGNAEQIVMWPLGGLAFCDAPYTVWAQFVTVASGPLVNVLFCVVTGSILVAWSGTLTVLDWNPLNYGFNVQKLPHSLTALWLAIFYGVNYWLLCFNLLPVFPLDGGRLLQILLWPFLGFRSAYEWACKIGIGGACVLAFVGLHPDGGGRMLLFIAIFGAIASWQTLQAVQHGLIEEDRYRVVGNWRRGPRRSGPGFFSRLFRRRSHKPDENPNPGGWQRKQQNEQKLEEEVDRILKKVADHGVGSLSYTEQKKLEQARRRRMQQDREFQRRE